MTMLQLMMMLIMMMIIKEVIRVNREFKCCAGCCWCANVGCCQMIITVEAPIGVVIGSCVQA